MSVCVPPLTFHPVPVSKLYPISQRFGTVTPRNAVVVRPRVDGQLMRVAFQEGQLVKAGDLLFQVDTRPFQNAVDAAAAKLSVGMNCSQLGNPLAFEARALLLGGKAKEALDAAVEFADGLRELEFVGGVEGEATAIYLARLLKTLGVKVTRIALTNIGPLSVSMCPRRTPRTRRPVVCSKVCSRWSAAAPKMGPTKE